MVLDIIIIAIFILSSVRGKSSGFASSLIRLVGIAAAIVCGVLFTKRLADALALTQLNGIVSRKMLSPLAFFIIVAIVWIIVSILCRGLREARRKKNLLGTVDSSVGLLFGMIRGAIFVLLFITFLLPATHLIAPDKLPAVNASLDNSYIASRVYDANPIFKIFK